MVCGEDEVLTVRAELVDHVQRQRFVVDFDGLRETFDPADDLIADDHLRQAMSVMPDAR